MFLHLCYLNAGTSQVDENARIDLDNVRVQLEFQCHYTEFAGKELKSLKLILEQFNHTTAYCISAAVGVCGLDPGAR